SAPRPPRAVPQPAPPDLPGAELRLLRWQGAERDQPAHEALGDSCSLGDLPDPVRHLPQLLSPVVAARHDHQFRRNARVTTVPPGQPGWKATVPGQPDSMPLISARQVTGPTIPSTVIPSACWKPRTAASVLGPKMPSTCSAWLGSPARKRNSSCTARTASPWLPRLTWMISADQVLGPTMPSTAKPLDCWKARTAASVFGAKMPSTVTDAPLARSRYCRLGTGCAWSPRLTSGNGRIVVVGMAAPS